MVRSAWVKPMTLVQKFEANESIAACYEIVCESDREGKVDWGKDTTVGKTNHPADIDGSNPWNIDDDLCSGWITKKHSGCKTASNNNLIFANGDVTYGGSDGWVAHTVDVNENGVIDADDRVYWCTEETSAAYFWRWNHWGTVAQSANRS